MASAGIAERIETDSSLPLEVSDSQDVRLEEFDEESPLGGSGEHRSSQDGDSNESPPPETVTAMPLIILPVQSEGIPTSGGFPMGRVGGGVSSPAVPLQGEELRRVLLQQLEYYFSKDNLSSDKYLLSQMDGDNYVPISVVSSFNQVKKLSSDMDLILDVLRESSVLQLDETEEKVRAIPEKRCVLILREIPKDTPKEEIVSLFAHPNCPSCVTCEFADNNCWYVTFDSEESTRKAHAYLREQVREFLGQPIRARIKGTTVQRSSGMPKTKHVPFNMFNGGPSQVPYYPTPPSGVLPWSPTPPTSTASPYFDSSSFSPFMGNGYTPTQPPPNQVGGAQSPAGVAGAGVQPNVMHSYNGARYMGGGSYPYGPMVRSGGEGDRSGRGNRMGPTASRSNRGGERPQSPPTPNEGDPPTASSSERDNKGDYKSGRGSRDHTSSGGIGGGVSSGSGGRYNRHSSEDRKIPRLKNTRFPGRGMGAAGDGERPTEKNIPPRQQAKQQQPKLDLAAANFPPLPTSSSSENGTAPLSAPPTTSHSHTSTEDGPKTLSDIVKGSLTKEMGVAYPALNPAPTSAAAVASSVVEKSIASAATKLSQAPTITSSFATAITTSLPANSQDIAPPRTTSHSTVNSDLPAQVSRAEQQAKPPGVNVSAETPSSGGGGTVSSSTRPVTVSSVVASGGVASGQGSRPPPPPPLAPTNKKYEYKFSGKDKQYGNSNSKTYSRYSDRDVASGKHNRNGQVSKSDGRSSAASKGRYKDRDYKDRDYKDRDFPSSRNGNGSNMRVNNGQRQNHVKSPKSFKKNFPPSHSPQAPPPPPGPAHSPVDTGGENNHQVSSSGTETAASSHSQSAPPPSKPEKLSYAQMAQKAKAESSGGEGVVKATPSPLTTPPGAQSNSKSVISASTGSLTATRGQSSGPLMSKSAPSSPTKESSNSSERLMSKENEV